jgi:hypothetical protein
MATIVVVFALVQSGLAIRLILATLDACTLILIIEPHTRLRCNNNIPQTTAFNGTAAKKNALVNEKCMQRNNTDKRYLLVPSLYE